MTEVIAAIAISCAVISAIAAFICYQKNRRTMEHLDTMLDAAMEGRYKELSFDETRLSRLESRFKHYLDSNTLTVEALASEKEKISTLISDIAHQTKTPIANLMLYSELLQSEPLPDSASESVLQIQNQAEKLNFLVSSLVRLSRLETGVVSVTPTPRPVMELLLAVFEQYKAPAVEKGLELRLEETESWAVFDGKWTMEAIGNIVDNAIKYTEAGTVVISAHHMQSFTCIQISDTGIGISEADTARIFGRFYRGDTVKDEKGVGIGLFISRQIIQSQSGYIKVKSELGKGSIFQVFLPASEPNLSEL